MQVYLVGGAVRDELLGLPVAERDWCVVGATPDDMQRQHFKPVGKDFPVFLHPDTGEEYALARTERKTAAGYHGFEFHTATDVSIEDDLMRRDLTINAMAKDAEGRLIDPHGGAGDLDARLLRHVSDAFAEDPVRILRAARFAARFSHLGFRIAAETRDLMRHMVRSGEADALVPDRVWKEMRLALSSPDPRTFFECLRACGALRVVLPEVDALFGVPQPPQWHPEVDTGLHTMLVLDQAASLSNDVAVRFAALCHDLGKARTDPANWPKHPGHEQLGLDLIHELNKRLPLPRDARDLALLAAEFHTHCHRVHELRDATVVKVLERTDAFRRPERFEKFLLACEADARGRTGLEHRAYTQADTFRDLHIAAAGVDAAAIATAQTTERQGDAIGQAVQRARIDAVRAARAT